MDKERIKEILKGQDPDKVKLKGVVDNEEPFEQSLTYFNLNGNTIEEMVDDLFETMERNPPESMKLLFDEHEYEL